MAEELRPWRAKNPFPLFEFPLTRDRRVVAHLSERAVPRCQVALREVLMARDCQTDIPITLAMKMGCFSNHDHRRLLFDGPIFEVRAHKVPKPGIPGLSRSLELPWIIDYICG